MPRVPRIRFGAKARPEAARGVRPWQLVCAGAVLLVVGGAATRGAAPEGDVWYALKSHLPGEKVPTWLYTGKAYRGLRVGGSVELFDGDGVASTLVPLGIVDRVGPASVAH